MIRTGLIIDPNEGFVEFPQFTEFSFLKEVEEAVFTRREGGYTWCSDIEHVLEENTGEPYLADARKPFYFCGDKIPGGRYFELFPYHYYDREEEEILGGPIRYKLILKNISEKKITVYIDGQGYVTDWNHYKTWEGALRGDNKMTFDLEPGEVRTLWEEPALKGGLPWSGIALGRATGDIWVCDYAYSGEEDPGLDGVQPQPDLTWPPYLLASFTRGTADWNAADIELFPKARDEQDNIQLSALKEKAYSIAIAYSPGGPITNLCEYKMFEPTFKDDVFSATDPLTEKSHIFFGGNYPVMYHFSLPMVNDTDEKKEVNFYLCSNDFYNVDTIAGIWINGRMLHRRVPVIGKDSHWRVFSMFLEPGTSEVAEFIVIPLGSCWGGMIATLEITSPEKKKNLEAGSSERDYEKRISPYGWEPNEYWLDHVHTFVEDNMSRKSGGIVFLGDSLTERFPVDQFFPEKGIINRGIGGDQIEAVLMRLDVSVYDLKPRKLFLQVGINDILFPRTELDNLKRRYGLLLNKLDKYCDGTEIIMQTLLPLTGEFSGYNDDVLKFNDDIRRLAFEHKYRLIDLHSHFCDQNGLLDETLTEDGVHLSIEGYKVWAKLLEEFVS